MTDEKQNKCDCNIMNLIKTEDTQEDTLIRHYKCDKCENTQEDIYKLIESKHIIQDKAQKRKAYNQDIEDRWLEMSGQKVKTILEIKFNTILDNEDMEEIKELIGDLGLEILEINDKGVLKD
tara:strand:+ start:168 stop:533 length:366 start_codon:yes stop_codon:yes gene_type:complete